MTIDPNIQLKINEKAQELRDKSDNKYAIKLVEKIVFYIVAAAGIAVLGALIKLVIIG